MVLVPIQESILILFMQPTAQIRKARLPARKLHLFLPTSPPRLLFLTDCNTLIVATLSPLQPIELLPYIHPVPFRKPLSLVSNEEDVFLLAEQGFLHWRVSHFTQQVAPRRVDLPWTAQPIKMVGLRGQEQLVVCEDRTVMVLKHSEVTARCKVPVEMDLEMLAMSGSEMAVGLREDRLPAVFTTEELRGWATAGFLEDYLKRLKEYYLEDEVAGGNGLLCLSMPQKRVYLCQRNQLSVLQVRESLSGVGYVLSVRMRVVMKWESVPLCVAAEGGCLAYAGVERIGECRPEEYTVNSRSIKQKPTQLITFIHYAKEGELAMLAPSSDQTRLFLGRIDSR